MRVLSAVRPAILVLLATVHVISAASITDLVPRADVIVIGTVTTLVEGPTHVSFDISVEETLKGKPQKSIHASQEWFSSGIALPPVATVRASVHGIWFLHARSATEWEALYTGGPHGVLPSLCLRAVARPLPERYQYAVSASLTDKLVFEMAAAQSTSYSFLDAFAGMDSPVIRTVLAEGMNSADAELQCVGLAGLIARGEEGAIGELIRRWAALKDESPSSLIVTALRNQFLSRSPRAVRSLAAIASDAFTDGDLRDVDLRGAAAQALINVHTKEALPFLGSLLESSSSIERSKGVFGLWSFANGCPSWSPSEVSLGDYEARCVEQSVYRTKETVAAFGWPPGPVDPNTALSFWRTWWTAHTELH